MEHSVDLTEIAIVIVVALAAGLGLARLKQPPILGYILTGIALGPSGLAIIESRAQINVMAELGVLLLLFVVGMELSLRSFKKVWFAATMCTILQVSASVGISYGLSLVFDWPLPYALLLGFVISLSSTAVVVKMMEGIGESKTHIGQLAIGILVAQDLAIVPMLLILQNKGEILDLTLFFKLFLAIGLIVSLIAYLSRRERVRIFLMRLIAGEKEFMPLASLTFCFGAAAITGLMGLSPPYGAFLAGLFLGNTNERFILLETIHPIQTILMMAFFLFIGMLLDLKFIWANLGSVLILLLVITIVKTALNIGILRIFRLPWSQAFLLGVVLAQLGEFSFLLATVSYQNGIVNEEGQRLIVALTVLSLAFSPLWMMSARRLKNVVNQAHLGFRNIFKRIYGNEVFYLKQFCKKAIRKKDNEPKYLTYEEKDEDIK
jgi:CPA2 family monovalent cation:H+ antiporter-2